MSFRRCLSLMNSLSVKRRAITHSKDHAKYMSTVIKSDAVSYTNRSATCGALRESDTGSSVRLCGWVQYRRMGGRFLVLRDWHGIIQLVFSEKQKLLMDEAAKLNYESVIAVEGKVKLREDGQQNPKMATGMIEVDVQEMTVLNHAVPTLPFTVGGKEKQANEALRMEYRYLDIRTSQMQRNLRRRSKFIMKMREFLANKHDFVDVETPTLFRRTPGGAKEFVVPTRHRGKFYSLPQSPQQFKQLLMVGGVDRYFQIARCYRDEGSRPDRQPEFTQLDLEMSFVDREGVISLVEELLQYSWPEDQGQITVPYPRLTYEQAMRLYGSDKPDTRFDMKYLANYLDQLMAVTDTCKVCGFSKIEDKLAGDNSSAVMLHFPKLLNYLSKSEVTNIMNEVTKAIGEKEPPYVLPIHIGEGGVWPSSISRHMMESFRHSIMATTHAMPGDTVFLAAGENYRPHEFLGRVRLKCAEALKTKGKILQDVNSYNFLWVVDFPLFMEKEEGDGLESAHHPFTDVHPDDRHMLHSHPQKVRSQHYDLVLNGNEVGGGSIRIHNPQDQIFVLQDVLKEDSSELQHLLEAFTTGCPPHGGIALGLDRLIAIMCGAQSIRDVIAFPKSVGGRDLMSKAPAEISQAEMDMYHIQVAESSDSMEQEAIKS